MMKKIFLIIIGMGICCAYLLLGNRNTMAPKKVVLFIGGDSQVECKEIAIEDCRDEHIDYCKDKRTMLFVNSRNQIIERNIAGEEHVIDIEAINLIETVSNVEYDSLGSDIYFIYDNMIYKYSLNDKILTKKTDGIGSTWRRTYIWKNNEHGYKLIDNGTFSELYSIDMNDNLVQKVCEGWVQSIGQVQGNKIYALEVYSNAKNDASTVDLRNRIIAIDVSEGQIETIQELGRWMDGNHLFTCNEEDIFYIQIKGKKEYLYRVNLNTGLKQKIYSTRNKVVGLAVD
ncbi:MAG: hypothetical protein K2L82_07415 [Lachnospiraceae bacterium]|nr:hypothetical protein [Lachnospiraceae bacterium]